MEGLRHSYGPENWTFFLCCSFVSKNKPVYEEALTGLRSNRPCISKSQLLLQQATQNKLIKGQTGFVHFLSTVFLMLNFVTLKSLNLSCSLHLFFHRNSVRCHHYQFVVVCSAFARVRLRSCALTQPLVLLATSRSHCLFCVPFIFHCLSNVRARTRVRPLKLHF